VAGFGLAVQAYQTRALAVVDEVAAHRARATACASWCAWSRAPTGTARSSARRKLGLAGYPVFTHKHHTDLSYLACAQALIGHPR
jgi:RHH-type proline utilization regulon transcriptional repressor/proline dehydrogenase/delta 1-pyrroline-5-carboxylate dehydrogenase